MIGVIGRLSALARAALFVMIMIGVVSWQAYRGYLAATRDGLASLAQSVLAISNQLAANLGLADQLLTEYSEQINPDHWPDSVLLPWLSGRMAALPITDSFLVAGLDGKSIGPGFGPGLTETKWIDVSEREYFRYHKHFVEDRHTHLGEPFVSKLDRTSVVPLSRGIFDSNGRLKAICQLNLATNRMVDDLATVFAGDDTTDTIYHGSGAQLVGLGRVDPMLPKILDQLGLLHSVAMDAKIRRRTARIDGTLRLIAYGSVPGYNLVAVASMRGEEAYARWRNEQTTNLVLLLLLSGAICAAAVALDRHEIQRRHLADHVAAQQILFADAIGNLADGVALFDREDHLIRCNTAFSEAYGFGADPPPPGMPFADIVERMMRVMPGKKAGTGRIKTVPMILAHHHAASGAALVVSTPDGSWAQIRDCRTSDGGILSIRSDITDLKRREMEIEALRRRYELILESAGDGILGLDADGRIDFVNRAACSVLRYEDSQLLGLPVATLFADGSEADMTRNRVDVLLKCGNGMLADVRYTGSPIFEGGRMVGGVIVFRDMALQRKYESELAVHQIELERLVQERTAELQAENEIRAKTEDALRASRRRLVAITDSLYHCILVFTANGDVVFANQAARSMMGGDELEVEGLPVDNFFELEEEGIPVPFAGSALLRAAVSGEVMHDNDAILKIAASGEEIPVAYVCTPLSDDTQRRQVVMSFRDIADIKRAQAEVMQASRLASVGQLASGIAHEINTPVQYIGNNLSFINDAVRQLLDTKSDPAKLELLREELPGAISESLDGVAQIARIVLSMKEFSHPGSAAKVLVDINHAIDTTLTVSANVWKQAAKVVRNYDPELPPIPCHAGEMNQVFLNLIVNAAHAIEGSGKPGPGTITITTSQREQHVEISIQDSGTGIPAAIRERIFDPFFTTKEVGKGTGQGLAICQDVVVTKHGGSIEAGGAEGTGAVFTVRLPIVENEAQQPAEPDQRGRNIA